ATASAPPIGRVAGAGPHPRPLPEGEGVTASPSGRGWPSTTRPGEGRTPESSEPVVVSGAWRVMAERMAASWTSAPHFFLMREVVASGLADMRTRMLPAVERRVGGRLTYTALLVKLLA